MPLSTAIGEGGLSDPQLLSSCYKELNKLAQTLLLYSFDVLHYFLPKTYYWKKIVILKLKRGELRHGLYL